VNADWDGYKFKSAMVNIAQKLVDDLLSLGVRPGGVLLVHSSLKSLGPVPGGAESIIRGFLSALGKGGTLLMPALTYETVRSDNPIFDVRSTPSCVGTLPEFFRTRPGSKRSLHPTHSVCAVGRLASEMISAHIQDSTPCGPNSPFHRLSEFDGQILMLGCGLRPNTSMHALEELIKPIYLFSPPITYMLIDETGKTLQKDYTRHNFQGWEQRYDRVAEILAPPNLRLGKVLNAQSHLIEASGLRDTALKAMRKNPLFFVEKIAAQ